MTITLRIQYKGDAARKLAADEYNSGSSGSPRYLHDMKRALGMFQIPLPENSRAVWKSGFVLCNWNITRDDTLFDAIYRGTNRAESIACKAALDGLSISYMQLFENSKRVFLPSKSYSNSSDEASTGQGARWPQSSSSASRYKPHLPLRDQPSFPAPRESSTPRTQKLVSHRSHNSSQSTIEDAEPSTGPSQEKEGIASGTGQITQATLRQLAESQSLLALLTQATTSLAADLPVKREVISPERLAPPTAPRRMMSQDETKIMPNGSLLPSKVAFDAVAPEGKRPPDLLQRLDQSSEAASRADLPPKRSPVDGSYFGQPASHRGRPTTARSFSPQPRGRSTEAHPFRKPTRDFERDFRHDRFVGGHERSEFGVGHGFKRHSFNGGNSRTADYPAKTGLKRPLSPVATDRQGRSTSPPLKRRWGDKYWKTSPDLRSRRSVSPANGNSGVQAPRHAAAHNQLQGVARPVESNVPTAGTGEPQGARHPQAQTLNRELWDIRRQITALKAREQNIVNELKEPRLSGMPDNVVPLKELSAEDRIKSMEVEIKSHRMLTSCTGFKALRERLQHETARRKLVQQACENESRRRKLAEDILDDTRRESSTPLMLPAMMNAFEKIAQLTGDALSPINERQNA